MSAQGAAPHAAVEPCALLLDALPDAAFLMRPDGTALAMNRETSRRLGVPADQILGKNFFDFLPPDVAAHRRAQVAELLRTGKPVPFEDIRGDRIIDSRMYPLSNDRGEIDRIAILGRDITEQRRSERELTTSRRLLDQAESMGHIGGWEWDLATQTMTWTEETYRIHGFSARDFPSGSPEHIARSLACYDPEVRSRIRDTFEACATHGTPYDLEVPFTNVAGKRIWVRTSAKAHRDDQNRIDKVVGFFADVTDRNEATEALRESERNLAQIRKTESLGRMAGAIAHHFNNQLHAVIGNLELSGDDVTDVQKQAGYVGSALNAAYKAAELSQMMLTYLGQTQTQRGLLDLADVCRTVLPVLESKRPATATLVTELPEPGPEIVANREHVQQVVTHLVINAFEAAPEGTVRLTVGVRPPFPVAGSLRIPMDWTPPAVPHATINVSDDGPGMSAEQMMQIFDPFYTTRFLGRGLGLPVVLGVARACGGGIMVQSRPGGGTAFHVFLPLAPDSSQRW